MKKKAWLVAAVAVLVIGIFGWDTATGYLGGIKKNIKNAVSRNTPTSMDVSRIEILIEKEVGKINDFHEAIADLSDKISGEKARVVRIRVEIKEQKHGLTIARGLIEKRQDVYFVANRPRTLLEVEHDASARIKYVRTLETHLVLSNTLIDTLTKTEGSCRVALAKAHESVLAKHVQLEGLKAREINAKIQAQANALSKSLVGISDSILNHSELQEAMDTYSKKISRKERSAGQIDQSSSPWIDYSEPEELPNLIHRIDEVLADAK